MNLSDYIDGHRDQHLAELCEFLRIPSVSAKSEPKPDIERGANWVAGNLRAAGFKNIEIVPTGLHPLVYAESLETQFAPRSISGLCSLLALTLGIRRNSHSSARCWSR